MPQLQEKVALVTGAARRVGAAIARRLHASGVCVLLHHRGSATEAELLAAELNAARPGSVACAQADLLAPDTPANLVRAALTRLRQAGVAVEKVPVRDGELTRYRINVKRGRTAQ